MRLTSTRPRIFLFIWLLASITLTGCSSKISKNHEASSFGTQFRCQKPQRLIDQVVGNGHCVALIRECSNAPHTSTWRPGLRVMSLKSHQVKTGSIVATFLNGKYPNKTGWHAAVYISHDKQGIWVWDQWLGKAVHKRLIRSNNDKATASNQAEEYRLVEFDI